MTRSIFAFALLLTSVALNAATMVAVVNDRLQSFDTDTGLFVAANWSGSGDIQGNSITAGGGQIYGYGAHILSIIYCCPRVLCLIVTKATSYMTKRKNT